MPYLDYHRFRAFLERHHRDSRPDRLVGSDRSIDSGYTHIRRFFGPGALSPTEVIIAYSESSFQLDHPVVEPFARKIERELRAAGRLYEGPQVAAIAAERLHTPPYHLTLQPCDYGLFAGSCFALDLEEPTLAPSATLREYLHHHPVSLPPCLGVCGLLLSTESDYTRRLLTVTRAGHLASLTDSIGPAAAGSVDFGTRWSTLDLLLHESLTAEITEELALQPREYTITPLAYAHEPFRGGKPQLFALISTELPAHDIAERLAALAGRPEFSGFAFVELNRGTLASEEISRLNHEAAMNYYLLEEYLARTSA